MVVLDNATGRELYNTTIMVGEAEAAAAKPPKAALALTGHRVNTYILPEKPGRQMFIRNHDCDPGCAVLPTTIIDRQVPGLAVPQAGGGEAEGAPQLTAMAGAIPHYDAEQHCDRIARVGGTRSETMYRSCMDSEQSAYDALKRDWTALPAEMRSHCDQIAKVGKSGSYIMLQACIQQEQKAGRDNSMRRFVH